MKLGALFTLSILIAGAGGAAWWSYQEGWWGDNPRAPTLVNFRPVVEAYAGRTGQLRAKCLTNSLNSGPDVRRGRPGIFYSDVPGLGGATLALKTDETYNQGTRERDIMRYEALARAGFYKVAGTTIEGAAGKPKPAREYIMTVAGWLNSDNGCFFLGRPEVLDIASFARVQPDPDGVRVYEIVYRVGIRRLPAWLVSEEGKAGFGDQAKALESREERVRLVRGERGWLPEPLLKAQSGLDSGRLAKSLDDLLPPLDPARIAGIADAAGADSSAPKACLILPSQAATDAEEIETGVIGRYSAMYFDDEAGFDDRHRRYRAWRDRLAVLVKAGVFRTEAMPRDPVRNRPPATRYLLEEKYLPFMDKQHAGCLRLGPARAEFLRSEIDPATIKGNRMARFKALGKISADAWARSVDLSGLPEAAAFLEFGVPVHGMLELDNEHWKLISGGGYLPVLITPPPGRPQSAAAPAPRSAASPAAGTLPDQVASVHVLAVYQAMLPGSSAGPGERREGAILVRVGLRGRPLTLVVSAYEPVVWKVAADPGVVISRVVVLGYHAGRVEGVDPAKVSFPGGRYLPVGGSRRSGDPMSVIPDAVARLVGRRPDSIQTQYETDRFVLGSPKQSAILDNGITKQVSKDGSVTYSGSRPAPPSSRRQTGVACPGGAGVPCVSSARPVVIPLPQREVIIVPADRTHSQP